MDVWLAFRLSSNCQQSTLFSHEQCEDLVLLSSVGYLMQISHCSDDTRRQISESVRCDIESLLCAVIESENRHSFSRPTRIAQLIPQ